MIAEKYDINFDKQNVYRECLQDEYLQINID